MKNRFFTGLFIIGLLIFTIMFFNSLALAQNSPSFTYIIKTHEVHMGDTVEFFVIVYDPNPSDILTITKEGPGDLVTVPHTSPDTGFYTWDTELADTVGEYDIVFYVNDGTGREDTAIARISVFIPDTIYIDCLERVPAETTVTVELRLWNDQTLCGWSIPLTFYNPFNTDVICDSVQWSSTLKSNPPTLYSADIYNEDKKIMIYSAYYFGNWPIGDNVLATLYFTTGATWDSDLGVVIDSVFFPPSSYTELVSCVTSFGTPLEFIQGCLTATDVPETPSTGISGFVLTQNYPNPFNLKTNISFEIPYECRVSLKIYNLAGQLVNTLVQRKMVKGHHTIFWDGTSSAGNAVASGVYFYKLTASDFVSMKKMILLK